MKNKKIKRSTIILISSLVGMVAGFGIGFLISPVVAGYIVASFGFVGIGVLILDYQNEKNKYLRDAVKRLKNEQTVNVSYDTLVDEKGNLKENYKKKFEEENKNNTKVNEENILKSSTEENDKTL